MNIVSSHTDRIISAHQYQGSSNDCAAFSLAAVLNGFEIDHILGSDLARAMDKIHWHGILPVIPRIPGWATFPWGMVDVLRDYGLNAYWRVFTPQAKLLELLEAGEVVFTITGRIIPLRAHVMVLLACDDAHGWGFNDPAYPDHTLRWYPKELFSNEWRTYGQISVVMGLKL